jgi:hypothetical protein
MRRAPHFFRLVISILCLSAPPAIAQDSDTRLTIGYPAYVGHPDNRSGTQGWNEGWFHNEGVLIDLSWPAYRFGTATDLRAGVTGGVFDNSIYNTSVFLGGIVEIETHVTDCLAFSFGTYAGGITGYETSPAPAIAPYIGAAYGVTEKLELGLRGLWLPAKTIGGKELATSDAYVMAVTVGTRF